MKNFSFNNPQCHREASFGLGIIFGPQKFYLTCNFWGPNTINWWESWVILHTKFSFLIFEWCFHCQSLSLNFNKNKNNNKIQPIGEYPHKNNNKIQPIGEYPHSKKLCYKTGIPGESFWQIFHFDHYESRFPKTIWNELFSVYLLSNTWNGIFEDV